MWSGAITHLSKPVSSIRATRSGVRPEGGRTNQHSLQSLCKKIYLVVLGSVLSPGTGKEGLKLLLLKVDSDAWGILETVSAHTDSNLKQGFVFLGGWGEEKLLH